MPSPTAEFRQVLAQIRHRPTRNRIADMALFPGDIDGSAAPALRRLPKPLPSRRRDRTPRVRHWRANTSHAAVRFYPEVLRPALLRAWHARLHDATAGQSTAKEESHGRAAPFTIFHPD